MDYVFGKHSLENRDLAQKLAGFSVKGQQVSILNLAGLRIFWSTFSALPVQWESNSRPVKFEVSYNFHMLQNTVLLIFFYQPQNIKAILGLHAT